MGFDSVFRLWYTGRKEVTAMLRRLRWKLVLMIMLILSGVLAAVLWVQTHSAVGQFRGETDRVLHAAMVRGEAMLSPWNMPRDNLPSQDGLAQDDELYTTIPAFCAILDGTSGRFLLAMRFNAAVELDTLYEAVTQALSSEESDGRLKDLNLRYSIRTRDNLVEVGFADLTWEQSAIRQQVLNALLVFAIALLGFFVVSFFLSRWLVRPVERSWQQQQQFVADASHELKTPLTVLLADADILISHQDDTIANQRKWVEHIQEEGLRMKGLVQDLLFLARGDAAAGRERPQGEVPLSDLCWNCLLSFEPLAFEQGLVLDSDIAENVSVTGSEEELRRLIAILLDNACKYCAPEGRVTVTLTGGERAVLTVHNDGEPIPAEAQSHLFERFYRVDASRERSQGGYGLGLAIAAAIVEGHRGKISVQSGPGEGTAFTVVLPCGK